MIPCPSSNQPANGESNRHHHRKHHDRGRGGGHIATRARATIPSLLRTLELGVDCTDVYGRREINANGKGRRAALVIGQEGEGRGHNEAADEEMHSLCLDLVARVIAARVGPVGGAGEQGGDIPLQG